MKKLVLKTAGITLATIILLLAVTYGVLALFFPGVLGDFFYDTGSYTVGIKYYEREYEKSGELDDLYNLCEKLDQGEDANKIKVYTKKLIDHKDFEDFCVKIDRQVNSKITTSEYIEGKYICALYTLEGIDVTITQGKIIVENSGYTKHGCFSTLISTLGTRFSEQEIDTLGLALTGLLGEVELSQLANLNADLELLVQLKQSL